MEALKTALDNLGSFAKLEELRELKNTATAEIKNSETYQWLVGFIDGRAVHEELGGISNAKKTTFILHSDLYLDALELTSRARHGDELAQEKVLELYLHLKDAVGTIDGERL